MSGKIHLIQDIFSLASRERCMSNLKKIVNPKFGNVPKVNAAVLLPLCKVDDTPSILYTVRSADLRTNNGEVSFPGGKSDPNESPIKTALRETEEEIGLSSSKIDVWGVGPTLPSRDNKLIVTPVIGSIPSVKQEDLNINHKEVAEVFTVPIEILCDPKNHFHTQFKNGYILPVFVAEQYKIWGITAYITHAFLSCILPKEVYQNDWIKKKIVIDKSFDLKN